MQWFQIRLTCNISCELATTYLLDTLGVNAWRFCKILILHQYLSNKVPVELKDIQKWMGGQNPVDTYDRSKVPKNSINHQYRIVTANKQRHIICPILGIRISIDAKKFHNVIAVVDIGCSGKNQEPFLAASWLPTHLTNMGHYQNNIRSCVDWIWFNNTGQVNHNFRLTFVNKKGWDPVVRL